MAYDNSKNLILIFIPFNLFPASVEKTNINLFVVQLLFKNIYFWSTDTKG